MANEIQISYPSGSTLYAVIRNPAGAVWWPAGQVFELWGTAERDASDYALALTDKNGSRYIGDFDQNIPAGSYSVQWFTQAGATPCDTDTLADGCGIVWTGTAELTAVKLLANKAVQDVATKGIDYYDDDGATIIFSQASINDGLTHTRIPN
jgi:hypothetical protein